MKRSKNILVRLILNFGKKYLPKNLLLILLIRHFKKFKREINKKNHI